MRLKSILNNLEGIRDIARDCEEDMWYEENAILEGIFREIADDTEVVISEIESVIDRLESCVSDISSIID